jgi:formyltetrahydrofolate hydrolase
LSLARLAISCPGRSAIGAAVSAAIADHGGNSIQSEAYSVRWQLEDRVIINRNATVVFA